ncbi:MAG: iron-containing alcohol dehydrogenase [Opitutaceae bacterium]|nr:iron-containing alcohol dehydrogenase [Opitutaceae bacterium]
MVLDLQGIPPVLAGLGAARLAPSKAVEYGNRVLVVRGMSSTRSAPVVSTLMSQGAFAGEFVVSEEPTVELALSGVAEARRARANVLIAIGGGSVIDATKAMAGFLSNPGEPLDHLEVIGRGRPLRMPAVSWIAVPTTAGTGAEATRNAVLSATDPKASGSPGNRFDRVKVSLRSPLLLSRLVVLDPEMLLGQPHEVRAATAMDAFTQLLEAYVCNRANPHADLFCEGGLRQLGWALPRWLAGDEAPEVRSALGWSAFWSGVALAQAGLGAVHGIAGPLGGAFPVPHGAACAALLLPVVEANLARLKTLSATSALERFDAAARLVTGSATVNSGDLLGWLRERVAQAKTRGLASFGVTVADHPELARRALAASSMKANPVPLTEDDLLAILAAAA